MGGAVSAVAVDAKRVLARRELERRKCLEHPAFLVDRMVAPDERTGADFHFDVLTNQERSIVGSPLRVPSGWYWQRGVLDEWQAHNRTLDLKARQLGLTWLGCAELVHSALYFPGSLNLVYRQKEEEANENVTRCWDLLHSLPQYLWNGGVVATPTKGARPHGTIELRFPGGRTSRVLAMSSASASGHGKTARRVLLDEFSRIDRASDIMKAVQPAAGRLGAIRIISTANGVANLETGEGNNFHYLWVNAEEAGFHRAFRPWSLHPDRDQWWYDNDPEIRGLKPHERAEQYPANEMEAFTLTSRNFFDQEALNSYGTPPKPLFRAEFVAKGPRTARLHKHDQGRLHVYREPVAGRNYALAVDPATERGADYSAAYVIDLTNMEFAAEWHGRVGVDIVAAQAHYLGRYYNTALIAVETGGYGEAVIVALRDGVTGRPPYPKLYRHVLSSRPDKPTAKPFGFPTNAKTRPLMVNGLEQAIRERSLPWLTDGLLHECATFVNRDVKPSPRAQDGSRDDRVMAACIAVEMYRLYGKHPDKHRPQGRSAKRWKRRLERPTTIAQIDARYPA